MANLISEGEQMTSLEAIQPRPRDIVFQQYMDFHRSDFRSNPYWYSPDHWYRWLVRLDCGCITEVLTFGDDSPPPEHRYHPSKVLGDPPLSGQTWILHPNRLRGECLFEGGTENPFPEGCCQPSGHIWCSAHKEELPWRDVVQWISRRVRQDSKTGKDYASWTVKLSCGHCYSPNMSKVDWSPGMPPEIDQDQVEHIKRRLSAERNDNDNDNDTRHYLSEQLEHNSFLVSSPALEETCPKCSYLRRITEYRLIDKLADQPIPEPPAKPQPTAEEIAAKKQRRLRRIESDMTRLQKEAEKLRKELETNGENPDQSLPSKTQPFTSSGDAGYKFRFSSLDEPGHEVVRAVPINDLGDPVVHGDYVTRGRRSHIAVSQSIVEHCVWQTELRHEFVGQTSFLGFEDRARVMCDEVAQLGVCVLDVAKVTGTVERMEPGVDEVW